MKIEVKKRLTDALSACRAIQGFIKDKDFSDYESDLLLRSGVERQLEIIGEALSKASNEDESIVDSIPELPKIVSLRNRIIHGYDSVDEEIVWDIILPCFNTNCLKL